MHGTRGLDRFKVWQELLKRSLARGKLAPRGALPRYSRPKEDLSSGDIFEGWWADPRGRRQAVGKRSFVRVPAVRLGGLLAFTLLAVIALPGVLGGRDPRAREVAYVAPTSPQVEHPAANDYVNPLAHAHVTPERIDMGVDYSGTGNLTAIGWARITAVKTRNTGWPGAFIEYRLLHGSRAGRYVYYAEGVKPAREIHRGRIVRPGRVVAHLIRGWSTGIEIGWGAGIGTETLAERFGQSTYPTRCGRNFSAFIKSLGGPPGIP